MCVFDIVILVCFIPAIVQGLKNGFLREACGVVALVLGVWLAFLFSQQLSLWILDRTQAFNSTVLNVISFSIILLVVLLAFTILGRLLSKIAKMAMLGWLDRLLGVVFSTMKALLLMGILAMIFEPLNSALGMVKQETLDSTIFYGPISDFAHAVFPYLKALIFKN